MRRWRRDITELVIVLVIAIAVCAIWLLFARPAHAFKSSGPTGVQANTNVVFGASGLPDPGVTIHSSTGSNGCLDFFDNTGTNSLCLSNTSNYVFRQNNTNLAFINTDTSFQPVGSIKWNNATDLAELNAPRSNFCGYLANTSGQTPGTRYAFYIPSVAITVRALHINWLTTGSGCTTAPISSIYVNNVDQSAAHVTHTNGATQGDVTGLSISVSAATTVAIDIQTQASGCTTFPQLISACAEYTTN